MIGNFEFALDKHDETIRRAEANAALMAGTRSEPKAAQNDRPVGRIGALLRRIAGTPAFA